MSIRQFIAEKKWKHRIRLAITKDDIDHLTYDMTYDKWIDTVNYCILFDFAQRRRERLIGISVVDL